MEYECQFIKKLKRERKIKKFFIIIVSILAIVYYLICENVERISKLFYNTHGQFDNSIMWTAISAIGGIIAFIGVIITIVYTEKSRKYQNEFEFKREKLIETQNEFEKVLRKEVDILDPIRIIEDVNFLSEKNYEEVNRKLITYNSEITTIDSYIYWFYDENMGSGFPNLVKFINEIDCFRKYVKKEIVAIMNCITNLININMNNNIIENNATNKNEEIISKKIQLLEDNKKLYNEFNVNRTRIIDEIIKYRELNLPKIQELGKKVLNEREQIIKNKLAIK
jgi:hypothetical protein